MSNNTIKIHPSLVRCNFCYHIEQKEENIRYCKLEKDGGKKCSKCKKGHLWTIDTYVDEKKLNEIIAYRQKEKKENLKRNNDYHTKMDNYPSSFSIKSYSRRLYDGFLLNDDEEEFKGYKEY